jgi:alkanesulfonate monooxygenase SsuD/methylene tetrahydromethanopterin reductase-like flavin-dependent oxidoreductase (luciferase family)
MQIGVGLPAMVPGTDGALLVEWARRADRGPFANVGVLDRVVYDGYDPFVALSAAAAVTDRVRLVTMVAIGPLRATALLAKQAAAIDRISGGRLTLGLALGARHDDYEAAAIDHLTRGRRFDAQLAELRDLWEGKAVGPKPAQDDGPELLVGGDSGPAYARMARYADGYVHGGGPPRAFAAAAARAHAAWIDAGRPGRPQLWGQGYYAIGRGAADDGDRYLRDYYAFTGPFAAKIAAGNLTTPQAIVDFVRGYEEAGCDGLVLFPTSAEEDQLDRLAQVVG